MNINIDNPNPDNEETAIGTQDLPPIIDDINLQDINEVWIRARNTISKCKFVLRIDNAAVSEFRALNDLLPGIANLDRKFLKEKVKAQISPNIMGEILYNDVVRWIDMNSSIFIVRYLPYLSMACGMNFHKCTIRSYNNRHVFEADNGYHDTTKAIYYLCDQAEQSVIALFITDHAYINHIHDTLFLQTDIKVDEKAQLYEKLIGEHVAQLDSVPFHHHLIILSKWQNIYKFYKHRLKLKMITTDGELLDYCRCLIMLSKYMDAELQIQHLLKVRTLNGRMDEAYYLLAKACRKRKKCLDKCSDRDKYINYDYAESNIEKAISENHTNDNANKEKAIIDKLIQRKKGNAVLNLNNLTQRERRDNCLSYNILSIDGGGIRGLIPAIWLRELEKRTRYTCSSMFQMMAGTSTGAIIAVALSAPGPNDPQKPYYDAGTLVDLYKTRGNEIFVKKSRPLYDYKKIPQTLAPKYSSDGKQQLFERYFSGIRLHECLTDILIPAVRSGDICTHLFTRDNSSYSISLVDVLMATTAAPTYFKPHCLNGRNYIDGGVQMNNPTLAAYLKAREYGYDERSIFVFSLGTGDYLQDPLAPNAHPDIFYYLRHRETVLKVLLNSQQHNVDYQMSKIMNDEKYYRWQVWLEEAIELDNYEGNVVDRLENIAYEYWEEMEIHDNNRLNRLIEHLKQE